MTTETRTLVSREPWWRSPPFTVDHTRPSDEEIRARKSCRLEGGENQKL